jgi:hypothetical protein
VSIGNSRWPATKFFRVFRNKKYGLKVIQSNYNEISALALFLGGGLVLHRSGRAWKKNKKKMSKCRDLILIRLK